MASKTVDEYPDCERCPNRIFNTGKYIQGGRGSIHGDVVDVNWVNQNRNNYGLNYIND